MLRDFIKQSSTYWTVSLFSKLLNLITLPIFVRVLAPQEIGVYEIITSCTLVLGGVVALEVTQAVGKFLQEKGKKEGDSKYVSTAFWFTFFSLTLTSLILIVSSEEISGLFFDSKENSNSIVWGILSFYALGLSGFSLNLLRWTYKIKSYAAISFVQTLVTQTFSLIFIFIFNQGVNSLFIGVIFGSLVSFICAFVISKHSYKIYFSFKTFFSMLSFSAPLALSGVAAIFMSQSDRFLINHLLSVKEVGEYSVAIRFSSIVSFLLVGFNSALTPLITKNKHDPQAPFHMAVIFRYFLALALLMIFLLSVFSEEYLSFFAGDAYYGAFNILPLLAMSSLLSGMYIFAPGLWLSNQTKTTLYINIFCVTLGVCFTYILVKTHGLLGAALSSVFSTGLQFTLVYLYGQKKYKVLNDWSNLGKAIILFALLFIISLVVMHKNSITLIEKLAFSVTGSLFILYPLIHWAELRRFHLLIFKNE